MIYPFQVLNYYPPFEDTAIYFNSMTNVYDYTFSEPLYCSPPNLTYPFYTDYVKKFNDPSERPTDDHDPEEENCEEPAQVRLKEENCSDDEWIEPASLQQKQQIKATALPAKAKKAISKQLPKCEKTYRKNLESNLINNVFSYICSSLKSHDIIQELLKSDERTKIFYIFAKNLKKLNTKYLSRKNIKEICEIEPGKVHAKMLAKSVKRLQLLPMDELRSVLRRTLFYYLRSETSLMPLLTSKKLSKTSILEHLRKRRQLKEYLLHQIQMCSQVKFNQEST